ncbi:MAG: TIGR03986 family CRISPR-associated RAMP protein [Hahellaceae bacterium]|nr:TIGR03986 family CRISPR-associated RAMP protein [Hahellaceae bacterium]
MSKSHNSSVNASATGKAAQGGKVHAPYNFVPLSSWIWFPNWGPLVSHDIPFREGISGVLDLEIKLHTPFLSAGVQQRETMAILPKETCDGSKKPMIPGSSLKGMVRNVVEIASFARMQFVDDKHHGFRDLHKAVESSYRRVIGADRLTGWLRLEGTEWRIYPCGYFRISRDHLKAKGIKLDYGERAFAAYKRMQVHAQGLKPRPYKMAPNAPRLVELTSDGESGYVVITGQVPGKKKEFLFQPPGREFLPVSSQVMADFRFIHMANPQNKESDLDNYLDWQLHKRSPGIPVFFLKDKSRVTHLGLSYMFRIPHRNSVQELVSKRQNPAAGEGAFDMAELLFGALRKEGGKSLRGRVSLDDAIAVSTKPGAEQTTILGSPHSSFYPAYVEQPSSGDSLSSREYLTYSDPNARIRGWKRYPVHAPGNINVPPLPPKLQDKVNVQQKLRPLAAGGLFTGKLRFHNLKLAELGALVWALTWGGDSSKRHALGMAKSLGFGQLSVKLSGYESLIWNDPARQNPPDQKQILDAFQASIDDAYSADGRGARWIESDALKQLLAMSDPAEAKNHELSHLKLEQVTHDDGTKKNINEFKSVKDDRKVLKPYVEKTEINPFAEAILPTSVTSVKDMLVAQKRAEAAAAEELARQQAEASAAAEAQAMLESLSETRRPLWEWLNSLASLPEGREVGVITEYVQQAIDSDLPKEDRVWLAERIEQDTGFMKIANAKKKAPRKDLITKLKS